MNDARTLGLWHICWIGGRSVLGMDGGRKRRECSDRVDEAAGRVWRLWLSAAHNIILLVIFLRWTLSIANLFRHGSAISRLVQYMPHTLSS